MIPKRIENLFSLIDFLHSNIETFKKHDSILRELEKLKAERNSLKPNQAALDKLKYQKLQSEIIDKLQVIESEIIGPIKAKVQELEISDWERPETLHNWNIEALNTLKENFSEFEIPTIKAFETKYLEFRTRTGNNYFQPFFFEDLDQLLKEIFTYFNTHGLNVLKGFEPKTAKVTTYKDWQEQLKAGVTRFELPNGFPLLPEGDEIQEEPQAKKESEFSVPDSELKKQISNELAFLKKPNSSSRIEPLTEAEFNEVLDWVIIYFENSFIVPKGIKPFQKLPANKGDIRHGFKALWFKLQKPQPLPPSLPELIGSLFPDVTTSLENLQKLAKPKNFL